MADEQIPKAPTQNTQNISQPVPEASKKRGGKRSSSWAPGVSGNPRGRPRKGQSFRDLIERIGSEKIEPASGGEGKKPRRISRKEEVVRSLFREAVAGNIGAIRELLVRVDGLPKREIDLTLDGSKAEKSDQVDTIRAMLDAAGKDPEKRARLLKLQDDRFRVEDEWLKLAQELGIATNTEDSNGRE